MVEHMRLGSATAVAVCVSALLACWAGTALGAAGTTMTPAEAIFNASLAVRTTAVIGGVRQTDVRRLQLPRRVLGDGLERLRSELAGGGLVGGS